MANEIETPTPLVNAVGGGASSVNFDKLNTDLDTLNTKVVQLKENRDSWKNLSQKYKDNFNILDLKFSEYSNVISKISQQSGLYNLIVDCTGVNASYFRGRQLNVWQYSPSAIGAPMGLNIGFAKSFNLILTNVGSDVTNASYMFYKGSSLASIDTSVFTKVTNAYWMFNGCRSLTSIDTSGFTSVDNATGMFFGCSSLASIDTKAFTSVTGASSMFGGCSSLASIDTSVFTKIPDASSMFDGCRSLTSIDTSAFTSVTNAGNMFTGCSSLTSITWGDSFRPNYKYGMFDGATAAKTITASADSKAWIEANVGDMMLSNYNIVLK